MNLRILLSFISLVGLSLAAVHPPRPLHRSMIDYINNLPGNTWKAGENFKGRTIEEVSRRLGALKSEKTLPTRYHSISDDEDLPTHFDAREQWPECPSIGEIGDQGDCGSCWVFGAVTAFSDRICIATNGKVQVHISPDDLLSCCETCGDGCRGGYLFPAWKYFEEHGVVTGGQYGSNEGCRPYSIPPCDHTGNSTRPKCEERIARTPSCDTKCRDGYRTSYESDKYYTTKSYKIPDNAKQIMKEVMAHGPIEVSFDVMEDFVNYNSGVYQYVTGGFVGGHAVKLLGWGVENGVDYWLLANSWNTDWGENGYFKIRRGVNMVHIESQAVAGIPKVDV